MNIQPGLLLLSSAQGLLNGLYGHSLLNGLYGHSLQSDMKPGSTDIHCKVT